MDRPSRSATISATMPRRPLGPLARAGRLAFALPLAIALATVAASLAGCTAEAEGEDEASALRTTERKIVGVGQPYRADATLAAKAERLRASKAERRKVGWAIAARVLAPVEIAERQGAQTTAARKLPLFRTWYGKDDVERMFGKLYADLAPSARTALETPTNTAIDDAFTWNATAAGSWTDAEYAARVAELDSPASLDGVGGNHRVTYSPGFVRHVFENYGALVRCTREAAAPASQAPTATSFAPCVGEEFPNDAVVIKTSWWRSDFGMKIPVYDTSAATLAPRVAGVTDDGGWGKGAREVQPAAGSIYAVKMADGATFTMPAIHIVTKELRDWAWITLWWSPTPNEDFGADRPAAITTLGGPWANYKMSIVTAYDEADLDPRGGFEGSLGDALAATHAPEASWTSNPYVERGAHNARTNCIGCHQHAGDRKTTSASILASEASFPLQGRTKLRKNFPDDYVFALEGDPENLARIVANRASSR